MYCIAYGCLLLFYIVYQYYIPIRGYRYLLLTLSAVFGIRDLILKQNNDDKKMKKSEKGFLGV